MITLTRNTGLGTQINDFFVALGASPSDYVFDNLPRTNQKLHELEARIARLEDPAAEPAEVAWQGSIG